MRKKFFAYLGTLVVLLSTVLTINSFSNTSKAATVDKSPDCGTIAIVKCGTYSKSEVLQNMHGDVRATFSALGISRSDVKTANFVRGVVWQDGRVTVNGRTVATGAVTASRGYECKYQLTNSTCAMDTSQMVTDGQVAMVAMQNGVFQFAIIKTCGNPVKAQPKREPQFACQNLKVTRIDRNTFRFQASSSAKWGAKKAGYTFHFGDGQSVSSNDGTVKHTYQSASTYNVKVTALFNVNGKTKRDSGQNCRVTVNVSPNPVYRCDNLLVEQISRTRYQFDVQATADNGAQIVSYRFNFGDGQTAQSNDNQVSHTYAKPGTYQVRATVVFKVNGQTETRTSQDCVVEVVVPEEDKVKVCNPETGEIITVKESEQDQYAPVGSVKCEDNVKVCNPETGEIITVKESQADQYAPKDSAKCEEQPAVIPSAGPAGLIGGAIGIGSLGAAGISLRDSRRRMMQSLLKR